jgi:hypothetical protein
MPSRSPTAHTVQGRRRSSSRPTLPLRYFASLYLTVPLQHTTRPRAATPDRIITRPFLALPSPHAADPSRSAPCRLPAARSFACAFHSCTIPPRDNPTPNRAQPPRRPLCFTMPCPRTALRCIKTPINAIPPRFPALANNADPLLSCSVCTLPSQFLGARFMALAAPNLTSLICRNSDPCRAGPSQSCQRRANPLHNSKFLYISRAQPCYPTHRPRSAWPGKADQSRVKV